MNFGVWIPNCRHLATPEIIRGTAVQAERLGYDSVWVSDHVVVPHANVVNFGRTVFDPLVTLAVVAGATSRVRLGTTVLIVPYRNAGGYGQDDLLARRAQRRPGGVRDRRRLGGRRERDAGRALCGARRHDRRVPGGDAGAVDEPRSVVHRQVHAVRRARVRAQAAAEAAPADLGGRPQPGRASPHRPVRRCLASDQWAARGAARRPERAGTAQPGPGPCGPRRRSLCATTSAS